MTRSYCVVTVEANEDMVPIHHRMPLALEKADWAVWLGEVGGHMEALLLRPAAGLLVRRPARRA